MTNLGEGMFGKQINPWACGPAKGVVLTPTSRYRWQVIFHLDDKVLGWDIVFNDQNTGNPRAKAFVKTERRITQFERYVLHAI